jgi:hypothetical protein
MPPLLLLTKSLPVNLAAQSCKHGNAMMMARHDPATIWTPSTSAQNKIWTLYSLFSCAG